MLLFVMNESEMASPTVATTSAGRQVFPTTEVERGETAPKTMSSSSSSGRTGAIMCVWRVKSIV